MCYYGYNCNSSKTSKDILFFFKGEVLYRVRWKNYCSDDDTWEPEAHLEDCHEVLLAFKNSIADAKVKKEPEAKKIVVS